MRFSYSVEYTCGKNLYTADTLSREPLQKANDKDMRQEEGLHFYVDAIMKCLPASKGKLEEIKKKNKIKMRLSEQSKTTVKQDGLH